MFWVSLSLGGLAGATPAEAPPALLELTSEGEGRPTLLVLRKSTTNMDTFVSGMIGELGADFHVVALEVNKESTTSEIALALGKSKPSAVVLLDNPTVDLYRRYQEADPTAAYPPAIIAMALFVDQTASRLRNATGIAYEVPAVTSFVRLRAAVSTDVVRVGVLYRPLFASLVADQARLAAIEGFEIVPVALKKAPTVTAVRAGLRELHQSEVDALWILNDSGLLTRDLLIGAWLPLMKRNEIPVVVGVADLLRTNPPIGNFAVVPDHKSLGMQAADLIYELRDSGWGIGVPQLPIAVETVLHRAFMEGHVGLKPGALDAVDQIVEGPTPERSP